MPKFSLGRKCDGDDEFSRSSLFSRSKNKSPNPSGNPYAQPAAANPYAQAPARASAGDAYQQAKFNAYNQPPGANGLPSGPRARYGGMSEDRGDTPPRSEKSAGNASQYSGGYGSNRYGTQSGYGADRYGGQTEERGSRYGPGGYGGLGDLPSYNDPSEKKRDALFSGPTSRNDGSQSNSRPPPYGADYGQNGDFSSGQAYGEEFGGDFGGREQPLGHGEPLGAQGAQSGDYGANSSYEAYGDRQLTAEEEEEEDVQAAKQEIRFLKQSDVSSTRNALRAAAMAEETGRGTLARLGAQGERIHNTEKNLDLTANHNRMAEDKAKELKRLNGSMFAIHPSNPFTASKRREQRDAEVMERHRMERAEREQTRKEAYQTDKRMEKTFKDLSLTDAQIKANKQASLAERAKFQFEADSEDEEMENEIDANLDALAGGASRLNALARATGKELDEQNRHLERINNKVR